MKHPTVEQVASRQTVNTTYSITVNFIKRNDNNNVIGENVKQLN